jgi:hypothetical protein
MCVCVCAFQYEDFIATLQSANYKKVANRPLTETEVIGLVVALLMGKRENSKANVLFSLI